MSAEPDSFVRTVSMLAPPGGRRPLHEVLPSAVADPVPFSDARRQTLSRLSQKILADPYLRSDAASVALGFWLRRANIARIVAAYERAFAEAAGVVYVPVGRVFHVAPGNVDTVFVYSWALAYLCGNQNIVRVSGQASEVLSRLLAVLSGLMPDDEVLASGNRFLTYEHDREITSALSQWATHRVLWGGDETITALRAVPIPAHASERTFASKFSYCVLCVAAVLAADDSTLAKLAGGFFNDLFWFEQMACSSPQIVAWIGEPASVQPAADRFHRALAMEIERRHHRGSSSSAMHRLNFAFDLACERELVADVRQKEFLSLRLPEGSRWTRYACGAGLITEVTASDIRQVAQFADTRDQTITHFGFASHEIQELARAAGIKGVDRIVPVGEALAFDVIWDGYDLVADFLHRVVVRTGGAP